MFDDAEYGQHYLSLVQEENLEDDAGKGQKEGIDEDAEKLSLMASDARAEHAKYDENGL